MVREWLLTSWYDRNYAAADRIDAIARRIKLFFPEKCGRRCDWGHVHEQGWVTAQPKVPRTEVRVPPGAARRNCLRMF